MNYTKNTKASFFSKVSKRFQNKYFRINPNLPTEIQSKFDKARLLLPVCFQYCTSYQLFLYLQSVMERLVQPDLHHFRDKLVHFLSKYDNIRVRYICKWKGRKTIRMLWPRYLSSYIILILEHDFQGKKRLRWSCPVNAKLY